MVTTIEKKRLYKREYARKWRVENPEKDLANQRRFQQKHQVRRRTQKREAYKADPEHYRLYSQNWRKANPEKDFITDRKSTRLNSSHLGNSYAVFCLKKK